MQLKDSHRMYMRMSGSLQEKEKMVVVQFLQSEYAGLLRASENSFGSYCRTLFRCRSVHNVSTNDKLSRENVNKA